MWTKCPTCLDPMEVDWTNNGVGLVVHGVHCGWGHAFDDASCFGSERECLVAIVQEQRHTLTVIAEGAEEAAQVWCDADSFRDPDPVDFAKATASKARRHLADTATPTTLGEE